MGKNGYLIVALIQAELLQSGITKLISGPCPELQFNSRQHMDAFVKHLVSL